AAQERAIRKLTEKRVELDRLAMALVEYETLTKEEIELVITGEQLQRPSVPVVRPV
ncbi:hypothetical protein BJ684DRAFT_22072, partial [Piptocephalis cylindrospora]